MKKSKKLTKSLALLLTTAMLVGNGIFPQNALAFENTASTAVTTTMETEAVLEETKATETVVETETQIQETVPETQTEEETQSVEDNYGVDATSLIGGRAAVNPIYSFSVTGTIKNAQVGYIYYNGTENVDTLSIKPYTGDVNISQFYQRINDSGNGGFSGYFLVFARANDGYLLTGLNGSGDGNLYALNGGTGKGLANYPGIEKLSAKALAAGYQVCFGWAREKTIAWDSPGIGNVNANFYIEGFAPSISVGAKASKTEGVIKGDKITITVDIKPETTLNGKTLTITSVSAKSATVNGKTVEVKNLKKVNNNLYQGTIDYTVTEEDCKNEVLNVQVVADTNYTYRLGVYDSYGQEGGVETKSYAEATDTQTITIAPERNYTYVYETIAPAGVSFPENLKPTAPTGGDAQVGENITLAQKPANIVDTENNGLWEFDGWYFNDQKLNTDTLLQTNSDKEFVGKWRFVSLSAEAEDVTYDGKEHGLTSKTVNGTANTGEWTLTYSDSENGTYTTTEPKFTDAGEHTVYIKATNKAGDVIATKEIVKIAQKTLTVKTESAEKDYDGQPLTSDAITVDGIVDKDKNSLNPETTGTLTTPGTTKNTYALNWVDEKIAKNYKIEEDLGELTVRNATIDVTENNGRFTWNKPEDVVYNGQEQKWVPEIKDATTGKTLVEGVDYEVSYDKTDFVNAGEPIGITITGKGVYKGTIENSYSIKPVEITLTAGSAEKVYDGSPLTSDDYTVSKGAFVKGEGIEKILFDGAQTQVGTSKNKIKEDEITFKKGTLASNYKITCEAGDLTVRGAEIDVTEDNGRFTWNKPEDVVYNGQEQKWTPEIKDATTGKTLVEGVDYEVSYDKTDFTNAGDSIGITITGKGDYEGTIESSYRIKPVELTLTAGSAEKVYDGTPLTSNNYTVSEGAFVEGEGIEKILFDGTQTQVGTSKNNIKKDELTFKEGTFASNYKITYEAGELTVKAATLDVSDENGRFTWNEPEDVVYNGQEQKWTPEIIDATTGKPLVEGVDYEINYDKDDFTNAGEPIEITIIGKGDYAGEITGSYSIKPIEITLTAGSAEKVYDGTALTSNTYTVSEGAFVEGEGIEEILFDGEQIQVGTSKNNIKKDELTFKEGTLASNYKITYKPGELTVKAATLDVSGENGRFTWNEPEDAVYNGQAQKWTPEIKDAATGKTLVEGVDYELSYDKTDFVNAGEPIGITITGKGAYEGTIENSYSIKPVEITLTAGSAEKVYDGSPLTSDDYTVSKGAFVKGEGIKTILFDGAQTQVGTSKNNIKEDEITFKKGTLASNYAITLAAGLLTVTDGTDKTPVDADKVVVKTHDDAKKTYKLGDVITYTIKVTNIYDVEKTIEITEQDGITMTGAVRFENVKPGETITTTASYTVTEADILAGNIFTNKVKVSFDGGKVFENTDDTKIEDSKTDIEIIKTAKNGTYKVGDTIEYTIRVVNKGNISVSDIKLKDVLTNDTWAIETIKPGEEYVFTAKYVVTATDAKRGYIKNTVVAEGTDLKGDEVNVSGETTVKVEKQIDAPKTGDSLSFVMYIVIMLICGSTMFLVPVLSKKRRGE